MKRKYAQLLSTIHDLRKKSDMTTSQMVQEYQESIDAYKELTCYFKKSAKSVIMNTHELLFDCLILSYDFEPTKLKQKERRNLTLGMFFMLLFELEMEDVETINNSIEINDFDDLELFVQNRLEDARYIMEGILYYKGFENTQDFVDEYTYKGIKKEASIYFGFNDNTKQRKK